MSEEETTESLEQPLEDSTTDQPEVSPEGETDETEESTEESEPTVEINGEQVPISELKQGYMRQADYTRKTQELATIRKTSAPKQDMTDEEKQVQEFIKGNNLMTTAQFNQLIADNNALQNLRSSGMTYQQEQVVSSLSKTTGVTSSGVPYTHASMEEIYQDVYKNSEQPKVVSKKVVGVKPKSGVKGGDKLTREAIAGMSVEEYTKRKPEILKAMANGTL